MEELRTDIIFFEELTPERRAEVKAAISDDPELARSFTRWRRIRAAVHSQINACVLDRRLLVLYALDDAGRGDMLSADERATLAEARGSIESAINAHPGLCHVVEKIQEDQSAFEAAWTAHAAKQTVSDRDEASSRKDRAPRSSQARRTAPAYRQWGLRVAGAALVALVAVVSVMVLSGDDARTVVATGVDEVQQITLADGSTVRLMANSRLAYDTPGADAAFNRTVELSDGRAFFDVASTSQRFVVETPTARTTALGTSFGVQVRTGGETQVVLASGQVEVAAREDATQAVTLQPGQESRVAPNAAPSTPILVDVVEALGWTGLFIFRDTPMATIAERLTQHYQTSVAVASVLQGQAVTGTFERQRSLDQILQTIATTLEAEVMRTDAGYRVVPRDDAS